MVPVAPVADFVASTLTPHVAELVTFTDLSTGTPTSRYRDFGDGFTSILPNPTHTYAAAGTYTIILIATNARGDDSEQKTAYVTVHTINPQLFYNGYSIDDSQIGCGKVIAVDCDNLHHYVNLCDLIEECVEDLPHDIVKECIRDFFNTTIDTVTPGYFLRVDAQHCIEAVDITTLLVCTDVYVKTNANDATAGYLAAKFGTRTNGCRSTNVIPFGPATHQQLQVELIVPNSPFLCGLPALPACDGAVVTVDHDGTLKYNCDDGQHRLRATLYAPYATPIVITPPVNVYKSYIFSTGTWVYNTQTLSNTATQMSVPMGEPSMTGTVSSILITKTGMYNVWMKGEAVINNGVSRLRLFIINKSATNNKKILLDCKFGGEAGAGFLPVNHDMLTSGTYTFTGSGLMKLVAGDILGLGCKIDTRGTDGAIAPSVERRSSVYDLGDGTQPEVAYAGPGICYGAQRYSSVTHGAS